MQFISLSSRIFVIAQYFHYFLVFSLFFSIFMYLRHFPVFYYFQVFSSLPSIFSVYFHYFPVFPSFPIIFVIAQYNFIIFQYACHFPVFSPPPLPVFTILSSPLVIVQLYSLLILILSQDSEREKINCIGDECKRHF